MKRNHDEAFCTYAVEEPKIADNIRAFTRKNALDELRSNFNDVSFFAGFPNVCDIDKDMKDQMTIVAPPFFRYWHRSAGSFIPCARCSNCLDDILDTCFKTGKICKIIKSFSSANCLTKSRYTWYSIAEPGIWTFVASPIYDCSICNIRLDTPQVVQEKMDVAEGARAKSLAVDFPYIVFTDTVGFMKYFAEDILYSWSEGSKDVHILRDFLRSLQRQPYFQEEYPDFTAQNWSISAELITIFAILYQANFAQYFDAEYDRRLCEQVMKRLHRLAFDIQSKTRIAEILGNFLGVEPMKIPVSHHKANLGCTTQKIILAWTLLFDCSNRGCKDWLVRSSKLAGCTEMTRDDYKVNQKLTDHIDTNREDLFHVLVQRVLAKARAGTDSGMLRNMILRCFKQDHDLSNERACLASAAEIRRNIIAIKPTLLRAGQQKVLKTLESQIPDNIAGNDVLDNTSVIENKHGKHHSNCGSQKGSSHVLKRLLHQNILTLHWDKSEDERLYRQSFPSLDSFAKLEWKESHMHYQYKHQFCINVPEPEQFAPPTTPFDDPELQIAMLASNALMGTMALQISRVLFAASKSVLSVHTSPMTIKYLVEVENDGRALNFSDFVSKLDSKKWEVPMSALYHRQLAEVVMCTLGVSTKIEQDIWQIGCALLQQMETDSSWIHNLYKECDLNPRETSKWTFSKLLQSTSNILVRVLIVITCDLKCGAILFTPQDCSCAVSLVPIILNVNFSTIKVLAFHDSSIIDCTSMKLPKYMYYASGHAKWDCNLKLLSMEDRIPIKTVEFISRALKPSNPIMKELIQYKPVDHYYFGCVNSILKSLELIKMEQLNGTIHNTKSAPPTSIAFIFAQLGERNFWNLKPKWCILSNTAVLLISYFVWQNKVDPTHTVDGWLNVLSTANKEIASIFELLRRTFPSMLLFRRNQVGVQHKLQWLLQLYNCRQVYYHGVQQQDLTHTTTFACHLCNEQCKTKRSLRKHIQNIHSDRAIDTEIFMSVNSDTIDSKSN